MTTPPVSSTSGHATSGHTTSGRAAAGRDSADTSENIDTGGRTIPMRPTPGITPGVVIAPPPFLGAAPDYLAALPELQTPVYPDGVCPWYLAKLDRTVATAIVDGASSLAVPTPKAYYAAVDEARIEHLSRPLPGEPIAPRAG